MRFDSHAALHAPEAIHRADTSYKLIQAIAAGVGMAPGTYAAVAQMAERRPPKAEATGSSPACGSKRFAPFQRPA